MVAFLQHKKPVTKWAFLKMTKPHSNAQASNLEVFSAEIDRGDDVHF